MTAGIRRRAMSGNVYWPTYPLTSSSSGSSSRCSPPSLTGRRLRRLPVSWHALYIGSLADARSRGPGFLELFEGGVEGLGHHAGFGDRRHEVGVAAPAGQDVHVEVAGDSGARDAAEVGAHVEAVG